MLHIARNFEKLTCKTEKHLLTISRSVSTNDDGGKELN